jgi:hypothetical protein
MHLVIGDLIYAAQTREQKGSGAGMQSNCCNCHMLLLVDAWIDVVWQLLMTHVVLHTLSTKSSTHEVPVMLRVAGGTHQHVVLLTLDDVLACSCVGH